MEDDFSRQSQNDVILQLTVIETLGDFTSQRMRLFLLETCCLSIPFELIFGTSQFNVYQGGFFIK